MLISDIFSSSPFPEMTRATWQTFLTWPSRCPKSLGAPLLHGTWFFPTWRLDPTEKNGIVCNYPARRSLVTAGGKKEKQKKLKRKNFKWKFQTQMGPNIFDEEQDSMTIHFFYIFNWGLNGFTSSDNQNNFKKNTLWQHFESATRQSIVVFQWRGLVGP